MINHINALETLIAQLTNELAEVKQLVNEHYTATQEVPATLTPNEQRKLIIEKAKQFIDKCKTPFGNYQVRGIFFPTYCTCEFVVNVEKRTVVALLKGVNSGDVLARGIAKCDPSDVFNEHIGKAIALGRALGLDVSEFENAVQPTEWVVGMGLRGTDIHGETFYYDAITKITYDDEYGTRLWRDNSFSSLDAKVRYGQKCENPIITDDTNAIYEEERAW